MNTFIQQGCIKLIKIDSKDIYYPILSFFFEIHLKLSYKKWMMVSKQQKQFQPFRLIRKNHY